MRIIERSLAAAMCLCLCASTLPETALAAEPALDRSGLDHSAARPAGQLTSDERILHALNRFSFGPRPGDVEAVKAMGLDNWFAEQLHPQTIDQSALQRRMAEFPAMQLSDEDLLLRLPSNAIIRQIVDGKARMPQQGLIGSIYSDSVDRLKARREDDKKKQQAAAPATAGNAPAMAGNMTQGTAQNPAQNSAQDSEKMGGAANQMQMAAPMAASMTAPEQPRPDQPVIGQTEIASMLALSPVQRVQTLAAMPQPRFDAFLKALKPPQRAALLDGMAPGMKEVVGALENPERVVTDELLSARLTRDIYSQAQLQEVMTDFWLNHFNVYLRKDETMPYYLVSYERDTIRPNSLGKFEDLLEAVAHSPAMMLYLDNSSSTGPDSPSAVKAEQATIRNNKPKPKPQGINENYARELMELHTLGVNGGYNQADVIQAARILTGWTVEQPLRGGGFKFDENRHEPGKKKVMGKKFKDGGEKEGRELLHFLATRPATAKFLSRKLAIRFVSDDPPQSLIDRMAKSYLKSDGEIAAVLETMYRSPEFWSPDAYRAKVKTPLEYVVSAARASDANTTSVLPLVNALRDMGMPLYGCIPPTGYKWEAADWVSTGALVSRMNFALSLASNRLNGITTKWAVPPSTASTAQTDSAPAPEAEETRLESELVAGGVSDTTRDAVLKQFAVQSAAGAQAPQERAENKTDDKMRSGGKSVVAVPTVFKPQPNRLPAPPPAEKQDQLLAGLLLGSPEFQRR
jgi:uncharacterized protein (DUF1800 family)